MRVLLRATKPAAFSEVLEAASLAAGFDLGPPARAPRILRAAASHLQQLAERENESRISMLSASIESYLEHLGGTRRQRITRPADLETVADELGITAQMTMADLNRLRREFALSNHPDRADLEERDNATRRMMVANMLIDREVEYRRAQQLPSRR